MLYTRGGGTGRQHCRGILLYELAQFSFLMVIPPILGELLLDGKKIVEGAAAGQGDVSLMALAVGFVAAFISGALACKWMINVVRRGKLIYFAIYCAIVGNSGDILLSS